MRSLLLANVLPRTFANSIKERCYEVVRRRGARLKRRAQTIFGRFRSISSLLVLCRFARRGLFIGRRSERFFCRQRFVFGSSSNFIEVNTRRRIRRRRHYVGTKTASRFLQNQFIDRHGIGFG